jgi:hypothetical protein
MHASVRVSRFETHRSRYVGCYVNENAGGHEVEGHHDVSKPKAAVVSWSAERMGPTIIAAPHRGHAQQVGVAQQHLDRAQVGTGLEQMRRIRMSQRVRRHVLVDAGLARREAHSLPNHLGSDGRIRPPPVPRAREKVGLRSHPAVVLTEGREERRTERHLAITTALALFDTEHHALAVDVADFESTQLAPPQTRTVERQEHRAVIEILGGRDQSSPGLRTTGKRGRCFGYGRSSFMSRRFKTRTKKNRRAAIWATTVPTASFRSSSKKT